MAMIRGLSIGALSVDGSEFQAYAGICASVSGMMMGANALWGEALSNIAEYFLDTVEEQFNSEGAARDNWPPLNDDYAAFKSNHNGNGMLVWNNDYRDSWGWEMSGGTGMAVDMVASDAVIIRSTLESTKHLWHEFGTGSRGRNNPLPSRPVLLLLPQDMDVVDQEFCNAFDTKVFARLVGRTP
jgi:phage gpG-like protein